MSSAAMVSLRMRLSANARSSAIEGSRWWHTISMSRCSSMVLRVNGRVGLVEDGSTFFSPAILMMSGAWPPPAPSVWKAWMVRPLNAFTVSSTKPELVQRVGMEHDLDVVVVRDAKAIVDRRGRGAPVLVQFQRAGAGLDHLDQRRRPRRVALAGYAEIDREGVERLDHPPHVPGTGRAGGGKGAVRRAGAAAQHRGDAAHQRVLDLLRADEMDVAVEPAGGEDFAFARDHVGAGADDDGDIGLDVGIAGLADRGDHAFLDGDVGLDDAPVIDDQRIGDDGIGRALRVGHLRLPHAVADHFAAAEFHLFAVGGEILLDLDDEIGIGEPHPVAGGGPEHVGIDGTFYLDGHQRAPSEESFPHLAAGRSGRRVIRGTIKACSSPVARLR